MRKIFLVVGFCFFLFMHNVIGQEFRKVENNAFQRGEKLTYRAYYEALLTGKITAGEATLEITDDNKKVANRNTMRIVGKGVSKGAFNFFFKVVDHYESVIDEDAIMPWLFVRRVNEGGYKITQDVVFNQIKHTASTNGNEPCKIPAYSQDLISSFYYARTFDVTNIKLGDSYPIQFFIDDSVYTTKIVFMGREDVKTSLGTFRCLKFKPQVLKGKIFKEPYPMVLWISDDENKVPVLAESAIIIGKVKMELIQYSGLRNPMKSKIK